MTVRGAVEKTALLMGLLLAGAGMGSLFPHAALTARVLQPVTPAPLASALWVPFFWPGLLALVLAILGFIAWHSETAQVYLAPVFALVEGMCLSSFALAMNARCPGVGLVALMATCGLVLVALAAYRFGFLQDMSAWAVGVAAAFITMAAGLGVVLVLGALGQNVAITGHATIVYWAIMCGFMVYLAQQLALSFRYIDEAAEMGAPKWMEWRAALAIMVSLVWIYIMALNFARKAIRSARSSRY